MAEFKRWDTSDHKYKKHGLKGILVKIAERIGATHKKSDFKATSKKSNPSAQNYMCKFQLRGKGNPLEKGTSIFWDLYC